MKKRKICKRKMKSLVHSSLFWFKLYVAKISARYQQDIRKISVRYQHVLRLVLTWSYFSQLMVNKQTGHELPYIVIGPSGLRVLHGIYCLFFSLSLLGLLFSQKGLSKGSEIWHWGLTNKKIRFGVEIYSFFWEKKQKVLRIT